MTQYAVEAICPHCGATVGVSASPGDVWCWSCGRPFRAVPLWCARKEKSSDHKPSSAAGRIHIVYSRRRWRTGPAVQPSSGWPRLLGARRTSWWDKSGPMTRTEQIIMVVLIGIIVLSFFYFRFR
jgi:hypothetical protein